MLPSRFSHSRRRLPNAPSNVIFCAFVITVIYLENPKILLEIHCKSLVESGGDTKDVLSSHLGNRVVDRALDELVEPFRSFNFKDQEMALMNAIVVLNPHIKSLCAEAAEQIADLRDRVQETLYNVVRESHPKEVASSRFGNLLLFLPTIMVCF